MNDDQKEVLQTVGQGALQVAITVMMMFANNRLGSITKRELIQQLKFLAGKLEQLED